MVNMNVAYRGPDGLSKTLLAELQARYGARAQNKGFVTGYMDAARRGELGGHFADNFGITHAVDIGVDIEMDGSGLLPKDALWVAEYLRKLGAAGKHLFARQGYLIHDMSTTVVPAPRITGAFNKWQWQHYGGSSPHSDHIHITTAGDNQWGEPSKLAPSLYNSTATWGLRPGTVVTPPPAVLEGMRPAPEMYGVTQTYRQDATQYNLGAFHGAVDIGCPEGTPLVAPENGVVWFDGWAWDLPGGPNDYHLRLYLIKPAVGDTRSGGGIITIIKGDSGRFWGLAHAKESFYYKGDRIRRGDHLQWSGRTGSVTGAHTHINLWPANPNWQNGGFGAIDPAPHMRGKWAPNQRVTWLGGSTTGVGAVAAPKPIVIAPKPIPKTVLEEIMALDRGSAEYRAVINDIAAAVLTKQVNLTGNNPEGEPYKGTTSVGQEAAWGTFRGFRDRRIEQNATEANQKADQCLTALKALTTVVLAHVEGTDLPDESDNNQEGA